MDITQDYFTLFDLPKRHALDRSALDRAFHKVQTEVHPDRFANDSASARRVAMQWATRANEAYTTLKDPLKRARYLCELNGVNLEVESNTAMPKEFLMEQMQWREALDDARDSHSAEALGELSDQLMKAEKEEIGTIETLIDDRHDFNAAAQSVRKLMFLDRAREDVERAIDGLAV
jgi:molecular chaperone HscB